MKLLIHLMDTYKYIYIYACASCINMVLLCRLLIIKQTMWCNSCNDVIVVYADQKPDNTYNFSYNVQEIFYFVLYNNYCIIIPYLYNKLKLIIISIINKIYLYITLPRM